MSVQIRCTCDKCVATKLTRTVTFVIPDAAWMTLNRHEANRFLLAKKRRLVHDMVRDEMPPADASMIWQRANVSWLVCYGKGTTFKADPENAAPTCKAILDAIVQLGYLPDDNPRHVLSTTYMRGPNLADKGHQITLTLEEA